MTRIKYRPKNIWHETGLLDTQSGRRVCVAQTPAALLLRTKGTRQTLSLPWSIAYLHAAQILADQHRAAKPRRRPSAARGMVFR